MSVTIKYAYLKDQTWMFRRNYPQDVRVVLGSQALKQSLKTSDAKLARARASEVNARFEQIVQSTRSGVEVALTATTALQSEPLRHEPGDEWGQASRRTLALLRRSLDGEAVDLSPVAFMSASKQSRAKVGALSPEYLRKRGNELRPGGFKSIRYSVGLFTSKYDDRPIGSLRREDGIEFLSLIPQLSRRIGKSERTRGLSLDELLAYSTGRSDKICVRTQKRIWTQVNHFLDWAVYQGHIRQNPFRTVLFDQKTRQNPYAVPTDREVQVMLADEDLPLFPVLQFCLLTGMRAGEAAGLLREDLVTKGNLGTFAHVRPNSVRALKTDASERLVPLHPVLEGSLEHLPEQGRLFPDLKVNDITKQFAVLRRRLRIERPGLVFHSSRKWFITQCERTGVPEHFTASLVGHKSARSENRLTYGIYSAGISDEQKRDIVDRIRLPA
ncbi:DUF6538 domain-containing protein [Tropicimonas sp. TH_r6]|uniref:DUF6538 domain-containing protein n=1 Tax=Tropicimonas sp. TH_r6 TaxID=3082085 RepID=UPI0029545A46|nr:DUF6538 domain-containing protein [Tropicimonas sp. TH_r6]MDV7145932.1 DUF6538 domain-containing protein [Tropicimonas sp. TH_r6]